MADWSPQVLASQATTYEYGFSSTAAPVFRRAEKIVIAYFLYVAVMVSLRGDASRLLIAWAVPVMLAAALAVQSRFSAGWSRVLRDWAALGLILVAYREIDWFAGAPQIAQWQQTWVGWDRSLLNGAGLRTAVESLGSLIPSGLELIYLLLYGIPPICMGALYFYGERRQIDRFLTTLFLGTFFAYALLPHFPSVAPRIAFANQDLPHYAGLFRKVNLWLLDHGDISTSVFPSGHVAVAFSAAFGMMRALPNRRLLWTGLFAAAIAVFTATIYCRYHYAADGLASIAISLFAWLGSEAMERNA